VGLLIEAEVSVSVAVFELVEANASSSRFTAAKIFSAADGFFSSLGEEIADFYSG